MVGAPPSSPFPFSSREGRICAAAAGVPGTGQHWGSGYFLPVELAPQPGGNGLTGIRPEERHPPLQKHAGLDCTRLNLHPKSLSWDQETLSALPPLPRGQLQAGPLLLLLFLVFLGSAAPQIPGELPLPGGHGSLGVRGFPAREQGDVSSSTAWATGHGTLQRRLAFQLHVNRSWKEKVSVVFPSCLPGGDNLDFLECKVVLGHLSACRQSEAMELGLEPTPGVPGSRGCRQGAERGPFSWGSALIPPKA